MESPEAVTSTSDDVAIDEEPCITPKDGEIDDDNNAVTPSGSCSEVPNDVSSQRCESSLITQEEDVHNDCEDGNLCGPEKGTQDNHSAEPTVADVDDGEIEDGDDDAFNDGQIKMESASETLPIDPKEKLAKLKNMRFSSQNKNAFSGSEQKRTVRSFLHEKGADELDGSRKRSVSPDEERQRRKRRHAEDGDEHPPQTPRRFRGQVRDSAVNPHILFQKCEQMINHSEHQGAATQDDDLRASIIEALLLESEICALIANRNNLRKDMDNFMTLETDLIKRIHADLPKHMQSVIRIDGDNIVINDAPTLPPGMPPFAPFAPSMFPSMGSLLGSGNGGFPQGLQPGVMNGPPPMGPNGLPLPPPNFQGMPPPNFHFPPPFSAVGQPPQVPHDTDSPELMELKPLAHTPPQGASTPPSRPPNPTTPTMPFSKPPPTSSSTVQQGASLPPGGIDFSKPPPLALPSNLQQNGITKSASASALPDLAIPPPTSSSSSVSQSQLLNFNVPPPNMAHNGDLQSTGSAIAPTAPYLATKPSGSSAPIDISKTLTSLISNAIKGQQNTHGAFPGSMGPPQCGMGLPPLTGPPPNIAMMKGMPAMGGPPPGSMNLNRNSGPPQIGRGSPMSKQGQPPSLMSITTVRIAPTSGGPHFNKKKRARKDESDNSVATKSSPIV